MLPDTPPPHLHRAGPREPSAHGWALSAHGRVWGLSAMRGESGLLGGSRPPLGGGPEGPHGSVPSARGANEGARWLTLGGGGWVRERGVNLRTACIPGHSVMSESATPWTAARQAPLSVGILLARTLEWVAMPSSRGSF